MVGVAGKSKGCATCRKRKVKCDETKPACQRCERSGLQCDRYERFPVFIDRDQTGYRRRAPLEEIKPYPRASVRRILSPEVESVRLISWYRELHLRSNPSQHALQTQTHWMGLVGTQQPPHPALKAALLAMSFAKWSQIEHNPGLRQSGRKQYQQSLELTQKALVTEDALTNDILATTCLMTLYELSEPRSSCQRSDSWLDHITGAGNLLCLRGPGDFSSAESRALFEHMRHIFMIRCLVTRMSCVFGSPRWRQLPWDGAVKSIEQQIFDQGLRLTSLRKDCDSLVSTNAHQQQQDRPSQLDTLLSTSIEIFETLEPLIIQVSSDAVASAARIDAHDVATNAATLLLSITALGIQLGAASSAHNLLATSDIAVPVLHTTFEKVVKAQTLRKARKPLARRILWLVETRMKMRVGALGVLRMVWSLQLAHEQFTPQDPETEQCGGILTSLSQRTPPFDVLGLPLGRHASSPVYRSF